MLRLSEGASLGAFCFFAPAHLLHMYRPMRLLFTILLSLPLTVWSADRKPPYISDESFIYDERTDNIPVLQPYIAPEPLARDAGSIESCTSKLRHHSYEGLKLIGVDADEVYVAMQNLRPGYPSSIKVGKRRSLSSPCYIDFSKSNREDIDTFLNQLRTMNARYRPKPSNFVFEIYKAAGLTFDGAIARPIGNALLKDANAKAQLYVNGHVSMQISRAARDGQLDFAIDLSRGGPDEIEDFVEEVIRRLGPGSDVFDRTQAYGIPLLERSEYRQPWDFGR